MRQRSDAEALHGVVGRLLMVSCVAEQGAVLQVESVQESPYPARTAGTGLPSAAPHRPGTTASCQGPHTPSGCSCHPRGRAQGTRSPMATHRCAPGHQESCHRRHHLLHLRLSRLSLAHLLSLHNAALPTLSRRTLCSSCCNVTLTRELSQHTMAKQSCSGLLV